jgi:hypothetical protein
MFAQGSNELLWVSRHNKTSGFSFIPLQYTPFWGKWQRNSRKTAGDMGAVLYSTKRKGLQGALIDDRINKTIFIFSPVLLGGDVWYNSWEQVLSGE